MTRYATILSTGRYVPEKVLPNAYFDQILNRKVDEWLVQNVGIRERHVMAPDETTSDLALHAAQQALARAQLQPAQLDLIIVATDTPDYISPGTSSVLQGKLGAVNAGTFDVNCACAGWATAMETAARFIMTDSDINYVLVVGAYGMTRFVDYTDHYTCTLFADGAGATVLGASDKPGFIAGKRFADGTFSDALGIYTGGTACPTTPIATNGGVPRVQFVRKFPATFNTEHWPRLVRETVAKAGMTLDDVDFYLFTQLNLNTIKLIMELLEQPLHKTHWIMDKWGYTGSACIPMALDDAIEIGRGPQPGDTILFCASGGGIAMAASVWRWTEG
ncbi:MAG: ketoacyl-ACP synthase III [Anaerolineales bacterium]|nr:ketoacyl-ACP synthase III [Anaerolineales bacterium]MCA9975331.1 ketoacyl-ACP synthase III [Anaerolineales bacterium]MCB8968912.1 ketoacyl-ACP synthase III [Ardenticatenaceae bacterium]